MGIRETHQKNTNNTIQSTSGKFFNEKEYEISAMLKCIKCNEELSYQTKGDKDYVVFNCKCYTNVIVPIDNVNNFMKKDKKCILHNLDTEVYCVDCDRVICEQCKENFHYKVFPLHHSIIIKGI